MSNYWAWKLKGTILEEEKEEDKDSDQGGFLDPWTSLDPDFIRKKIAKDIIAVYKNGGFGLDQKKIQSVQVPFWALLYPKRSYLPPDYPHLQLWYLSEEFCPSLQFLNLEKRKGLADIVEKMKMVYDQILGNDSHFSLAINATPFSFIKNEEGKYYAGGQSVRTFHLHFLGIPQNLEKREFKEKEAALVYPTKFSYLLLEKIFSKKAVQDHIFKKDKVEFETTERGIVYRCQADTEELVLTLGRLDEIMYQIQLSLIYTFYQDSESFLELINRFAKEEDLEVLEKELSDLVLLGYERRLSFTKDLLNKEFHRLGRKYDMSFENEEIAEVTDSLTSDQNGDLASWIGDQKVVLRPGMGYGTMVKFKGGETEISVAPLDSLRSEGTMESNGYYFTEKVKINKKQKWVDKVIGQLEKE